MYHECVYAICAEFWAKTGTDLPKLSASNKRKSEDYDPTKCDHKNLSKEEDGNYFTLTYQKTLQKDNHFPITWTS
eukprot:1477355-Ditylum_brightwellii.AAC.1